MLCGKLLCNVRPFLPCGNSNTVPSEMVLENTLQKSYYFNQNEIYIMKCDIVRVSDWTKRFIFAIVPFQSLKCVDQQEKISACMI